MLFSPGRLSAKSLPGISYEGFSTHAEFEMECSRCHAPLSTTQDKLCIDCHTEVSEQIARQEGIHGKINQVNRCGNCHPEHHGRKFDPSLAAQPRFNHTVTDFDLLWHQVDYDMSPMECVDCHKSGMPDTMTEEQCVLCHQTHDIDFMLHHLEDYGTDCLDCHDGTDQMTRVDHSQTSFPLEGKHASLACAECHSQDAQRPGQANEVQEVSLITFKATPQECSGCHAEPQSHAGVFKSSCEDCHQPDGWTPATLNGKTFDHTTLTGFSLQRHAVDYSQKPITCTSCHSSDFTQFDLQTCVTCHSSGPDDPGGKRNAFIQEHQAQFGTACLDCHDGVDRFSDFDHSRIFPLDGKHAEIQCDACHQNKVFKDTPVECVGCHAEPEIHKGFFGLDCQYCHSTQAWAPAALREHVFPLDHGGKGEVPCKTCHVETYADYTCYGCHDHQPDSITKKHVEEGISLEELPACAECHPDGR